MTDAAPRRELLPFELAAFSAWARTAMVVQGGRLADHFQSDRIAFANRVLVEAEARGWIIRRNYEPTPEMRFFGIGGYPGRKDARQAPEDAYHVEFAWEVQPSAPLDVEPPAPLTLEQRAQLDELSAHHERLRQEERLLAAAWIIGEVERIETSIRTIPRRDICRTKRAKPLRAKP